MMKTGNKTEGSPGTSSPGSLFELAKCQKWKSGQWRNAYLHNIIFCQTKVHAVLQSIDFTKIFNEKSADL
jgi:hypothetical protein